MFNLNCFKSILNSSWSVWSMRKNEAKRLVLLSTDLRQGQGQWRWYEMIEVNGAYKHGRYEKNMVEKIARNVQW